MNGLKKKIFDDNFITRIYILGYMYMALPTVIFLCGWCKLVFAIPITVALFLCLWRMIRTTHISQNIRFDYGVDKKQEIFLFFIIVFLWVLLSGISSHSYQNEDFYWRNGMFDLLYYNKWPVIENIPNVGERGFSYYCGFWLPAISLGKLFGYSFANNFQIIWALLGIIIFFVLIWNYVGSIKLWHVLLFIGFSGLDYIGVLLTANDISQIDLFTHLEWWTKFQYSGFTTQLYWVFNQAIPAWVATVMIISNKQKKHMILILALMMINCTMPFAGLSLICLFVLLRDLYIAIKQHNIKEYVFGIISFENILLAGSIAIVMISFLQKKMVSSKIKIYDIHDGAWVAIFLFLFLEVYIYAVFVFRQRIKDGFLLPALLLLTVLPFIVLQDEGNLCMRASIPALVILYLNVIRALEKYYANNKRYFVILICILLVGSITSIHEISRSIHNTMILSSNDMDIKLESKTSEEILTNDFESTNVDDNIFYRYIAK